MKEIKWNHDSHQKLSKHTNKKTHTLTRNWILIKRNYEKLWFSGKEYEYLYYNWARTNNTHTINSSYSVEEYKKQKKKRKIAIGFFLKHYFIKQQQML